MSGKKRKRFTAEQKVSIIKQHLLERKPISDVCDENEIHPTIFYRWQNQLFSKMPFAFQNSEDKEARHWKKRALELENQLIRKNEVLAELMEEYIALKKNHGGS